MIEPRADSAVGSLVRVSDDVEPHSNVVQSASESLRVRRLALNSGETNQSASTIVLIDKLPEAANSAIPPLRATPWLRVEKPRKVRTKAKIRVW